MRNTISGLGRAALAAAALAIGATGAHAVDISGAGATFPYPIYAKWADAYKKETGIGLNYQSIGSGGGIKQIQDQDRDLRRHRCATDGRGSRRSSVSSQFPAVMGGIVPVVNLEGIKPGELVIDGPTLAKIFLGEITKWDDAAIKKLNPNAKLPSQAIAVVHRSDGSGTTYQLRLLPGRGQRGLEVEGRRQHRHCNGPSASAPRATKASPTTSPRPRVRSAMSSMPMRSRTS